MSRTAWRVVKWTAFGVGGATLALVTIFVIVVVIRVGEKGGAPRSSETPVERVADGEPIPQLEKHTCGLLALSAAYRMYGLSPEEKNLRFRLGVDTPAQPLDSTSTGTLHPDLFRVLRQDGFVFEMIDPLSTNAIDDVAGVIGRGECVLTLIRRRESGGLHWVLVDRADGETMRVVDSLKDSPTDEASRAFLLECVLSLVAIRPSEEEERARLRADSRAEARAISEAHRQGLAEMARVRERLNGMRVAGARPVSAGLGRGPSGAEEGAAEAPRNVRARLIEIGRTYRESLGLASDAVLWAPTQCVPPEPQVEMSASGDGETHGSKLYVLYARDVEGYKKLTEDRAAGSAGDQVIVKETWLPVNAEGDGPRDARAPRTRVKGKDGVEHMAGEKGPVFVMLRTGGTEAWADAGWVYATLTADGTRVTGAGRMASCMGCHEKAGEGRLFGMKRE